MTYSRNVWTFLYEHGYAALQFRSTASPADFVVVEVIAPPRNPSVSVQSYRLAFLVTFRAKSRLITPGRLKVQLLISIFLAIVIIHTLQKSLSRAVLYPFYSDLQFSFNQATGIAAFNILWATQSSCRKAFSALLGSALSCQRASNYQTFKLGYTAMLDGLSLVAGVITLTGGVVEVVKYARTFYRASEELGELQACFDVLHWLPLVHFTLVAWC